MFAPASLRPNLLAGLTVGIVALPLSMALAIASGVAPQYGLYTAIVAGIVTALSGSSRVNISGPTAAFVVILLPIVQQFGFGGLLIAGFMAGVILIAMGVLKLGTLIELVPYPVTVGFTSGIAVVIAITQLKDFLGLPGELTGHGFIEKGVALVHALPGFRWPELLVGVVTLSILLLWGRRESRIPAHLVALVGGSLLAWGLAGAGDGFSVATIASSFHYSSGDLVGSGIPPVAPQWVWPWQQPDAAGNAIGLSWHVISSLTGAAIAIALLGAIESLLCAVVSDSMVGTRTDPNRELIGQGLGNIIAPFFAAIPATAAIARTATNIRAGATSPLSSLVHALVILLSILLFAPLLGVVPMASMAALLLVVAWNMGEAHHFIRMLRVAPAHDIMVLLTCFILTVTIDMEVAVAAGMALASVLFIKRMIELTGVKLISTVPEEHAGLELPAGVLIYDINGPMFFGAAQNALKTLLTINDGIRVVILDMRDVPMIDMTAMVAMQSIVSNLEKHGIGLVFCELAADVEQKLLRAGVISHDKLLRTASIGASVSAARKMIAESGTGDTT
ncbi:MAG: C4-dicarboxylic acid transporter DauA [Mariprofundaceae bacterium]|nr:C4-dicarboxylic acid transporter DauA [Mariprofundaceae bacterium]